jgi:hypothetical protein
MIGARRGRDDRHGRHRRDEGDDANRQSEGESLLACRVHGHDLRRED